MTDPTRFGVLQSSSDDHIELQTASTRVQGAIKVVPVKTIDPTERLDFIASWFVCPRLTYLAYYRQYVGFAIIITVSSYAQIDLLVICIRFVVGR